MDRNTNCTSIGRPKRLSLSARRAWIEIDAIAVQAANSSVALRKESVDRNVNLRVLDGSKSVALRKESVDRNELTFKIRIAAIESLSARRAWIEMGIK